MTLALRDLGKDRESSLANGYLYRFGPFALDARKRTLSRADSPISLTPKAFEEGNLTQYISHLRKALGDNSEDTRLIVTIARKGYQFTARVTVAEAAAIAKPAAVQVPGMTESSRFDARPIPEYAAKEAVPKTPKHWRNAAALAASAVILATVAYTSWRHFAGMTPPRSQEIMLAVLPFENLTGDPNKEYLADGLTEETISQLVRLNAEQLGVIARTSVMGYKHKDERLDQIGRDLSVQYVLENFSGLPGSNSRCPCK
jgi:DNA-binding winged helix-turn-helix (wHTH) protein